MASQEQHASFNPADPAASMSHRDKVAKLSRNGLVAMLICMFVVPIATVLSLWYYLPPVSIYTLSASIQFSGLSTAKDFDRRDQNSTTPEPLVIIKNTGQEPWTHMIIEINKRYKLSVTEKTVEPGKSIALGLDYFQTREGVFYAPGRIPLQHVRVYARLPTGARATHEMDR